MEYDDVIKMAEEFWQRLQDADEYHRWMAVSYLLEKWAKFKLHRSREREKSII